MTYVIAPLYAARTKRCSASRAQGDYNIGQITCYHTWGHPNPCSRVGIFCSIFKNTSATCAYPLVGNARKLKRDKRAHACAQGTFSYTPCSRRGLTKKYMFVYFLRKAPSRTPSCSRRGLTKKYMFFVYIFFVRPLLVPCTRGLVHCRIKSFKYKIYSEVCARKLWKLAANFFKDLNQKFASYNKVFFYSKAILKVSWTNIEKWLSYNEFVGFDYAHVANWDMRDLVLFLRLFDQYRIHS